MNRIKQAKLVRAFGYALSATCLVVLALQVNWPMFIEHIGHARLSPIAVAAGLLIVTYFLFALRWRLLLSFEPKPSLIQVASFLMLGYLGNLMMPMRAGDAARVLLIRNAYGHGGARALSSILLERLLDVLAVLLFGAALAFAAPLPETILVVLRSSAAIVGLAVILLGLFAARPGLAISVVDKMTRRFSPNLADAVALHAKHFAEALEIIFPADRRSTARVGAILVLTALGWSSYGAAMVLCTTAFDVNPAVPAGLLMMVVTNLGSAIPSSPGSLGVYHALAVLALSAWNVGLDLALSVATVSHATVIGVQLLLGLLTLAVVGRKASLLRVVRDAKSE